MSTITLHDLVVWCRLHEHVHWLSLLTATYSLVADDCCCCVHVLGCQSVAGRVTYGAGYSVHCSVVLGTVCCGVHDCGGRKEVYNFSLANASVMQ